MGYQTAFIPFMIGSISLVAFLSIRNTHLSKNTRVLCDRIKDNRVDSEESAFWESNFTLQVHYFSARYMRSNSALVLSIISILLFGAMIGLIVISDAGLRSDWASVVSLVLLILGGAGATIATAISVRETLMARRSLCAHVAATIVTAQYQNPNPSLHSVLSKIEATIGSTLESDLHGQLRAKLQQVGELAKPITDAPLESIDSKDN